MRRCTKNHPVRAWYHDRRNSNSYLILDDPDQTKSPIGAQGTAAIYTGGEHGAWAALRKISIRGHSWFNWLYPLSF